MTKRFASDLDARQSTLAETVNNYLDLRPGASIEDAQAYLGTLAVDEVREIIAHVEEQNFNARPNIRAEVGSDVHTSRAILADAIHDILPALDALAQAALDDNARAYGIKVGRTAFNRQ